MRKQCVKNAFVFVFTMMLIGGCTSEPTMSYSDALKACESDIESAVRGAGSSAVDMMQAGEEAKARCLAKHGWKG